ncbi:hypothetical protein WG66_012602 [Moniliophthora roreri]|nr:hypothetical protein WG66_012602 [Moniliophthora roreri]
MSQQLSVFIWLDTGLCKMWIMRVRGRSAFVLREECFPPSPKFRPRRSQYPRRFLPSVSWFVSCVRHGSALRVSPSGSTWQPPDSPCPSHCD